MCQRVFAIVVSPKPMMSIATATRTQRAVRDERERLHLPRLEDLVLIRATKDTGVDEGGADGIFLPPAVGTLNAPEHGRLSGRAGRRLHFADRGAIAQLGERLDRTQEVAGSSPASSIKTPARQRFYSFGWFGRPGVLPGSTRMTCRRRTVLGIGLFGVEPSTEPVEPANH
jgi:hypothetical protein